MNSKIAHAILALLVLQAAFVIAHQLGRQHKEAEIVENCEKLKGFYSGKKVFFCEWK